MVTWRDLYAQEIDRQAEVIRNARRIGQTWLVINGRTVDPTRMSEREILDTARKEAERLINYTINLEREAARKRGAPDGEE